MWIIGWTFQILYLKRNLAKMLRSVRAQWVTNVRRWKPPSKSVSFRVCIIQTAGVPASVFRAVLSSSFYKPTWLSIRNKRCIMVILTEHLQPFLFLMTNQYIWPNFRIVFKSSFVLPKFWSNSEISNYLEILNQR